MEEPRPWKTYPFAKQRWKDPSSQGTEAAKGSAGPGPCERAVSAEGGGWWRLTPLGDDQLRHGDVVVHVGGVLHGAAERPVVLHGGVVNAYGRVPSVHISHPGNSVPERAGGRGVLEGLVVENLRERHREEKR